MKHVNGLIEEAIKQPSFSYKRAGAQIFDRDIHTSLPLRLKDRMKTFAAVILFLAVSAISTEAREIKLAKHGDYKQPQTFPGFEGLMPNPGLGIGAGIPGGGFGLPSISAPPVLGGGSSLPSFGGLPGFPGAGFGAQPRVPGQP